MSDHEQAIRERCVLWVAILTIVVILLTLGVIAVATISYGGWLLLGATT